MNRAVFLLRMPEDLRQAIRDRAKLENRSQNNLINSLIKLYLKENPYSRKTVSRVPGKDF